MLRALKRRERQRQGVALRRGVLSVVVSFFVISLQQMITCMEWVIEKLTGRVAPEEVFDVVEGALHRAPHSYQPLNASGHAPSLSRRLTHQVNKGACQDSVVLSARGVADWRSDRGAGHRAYRVSQDTISSRTAAPRRAPSRRRCASQSRTPPALLQPP